MQFLYTLLTKTPCSNCNTNLESHTNRQLIQCANAELSKINISLESDSTPESSDETPTGGFII